VTRFYWIDNGNTPNTENVSQKLRHPPPDWAVSEANLMTRKKQRRSGWMVGDKRQGQRVARAKRGSYW